MIEYRYRIVFSQLSAFLLFFIWSNMVWGHGRNPAGMAAMFKKTELHIAGTSYGLLFKVDQSGKTKYKMICEEAMKEQKATWYHRTPSGRVLVGTFEGLWYTDDDGCSWTSPDKVLAKHTIPFHAFDPADPNRVFVATSSGNMANGIFESVDGGKTWKKFGPVDTDLIFGTLLVAPKAEALWTVVYEIDAEKQGIRQSTDQGKTWKNVAADLSKIEAFNLLWYDTAKKIIYFSAHRKKDGQILLFKSEDGFKTIQEMQGFEDKLMGITRFKDELYLITVEHLFKQAKGKTAFEKVQKIRSQCIFTDPSEKSIWLCIDIKQSPGHFLMSENGKDFAPKVLYSDVFEGKCPKGTTGAEECPKIWPLMQKDGVGLPWKAPEPTPEPNTSEEKINPTDAGSVGEGTSPESNTGEKLSADAAEKIGDNTAPGSCGCSLNEEGGSSFILFTLFVMVLFLRRYRP